MKIKKLKIIDLKSRGKIIKFLNIKNLGFKKFKEIYFSETPPNVFKGWKYHENRNQILTIIKGSAVFFFKKDKELKIKKIIISYPRKIYKIFIPKKTYYAFKCISKSSAIIVNIIDEIV
jgi:dTDP-4-dehydrorhamnose 3,5-epimerase-like enzyme